MIDAARCMEPVNALLEGDIERAVDCVLDTCLAEPDVAFGWVWGYAQAVDRLVARIRYGDEGIRAEIGRDVQAFIGAAQLDDIEAAYLVWETLEGPRAAQVVYLLAEIVARAIRIKAAS